jgi:hypothetical protein
VGKWAPTVTHCDNANRVQVSLGSHGT